MSFKFGLKSNLLLGQCEKDLADVMKLAIQRTKFDFGLTEALRTIDRQRDLFEAGKSTTMNSRHLPNDNGLSDAIDIAIYIDGKVTWDIRYYRAVAQVIFECAIELNVQIEWGGLWMSFIDGPHYQLKR